MTTPTPTIIVTTLFDETYGGWETVGAPDGSGLSLREAIALAAAGDGTDVIGFDPSLASQTFELTDGPLTVSGGATITIIGDVTIDAKDRFGVFELGAGNLNLFDVTLTGGNASAGGGAVRVEDGGTATLERVTVEGNSGTSGGGIKVTGSGNLNLVNSTVSNNEATSGEGGGIDFETSTTTGTLTVVNSTIYGNVASTTSGGIAAEDATVDITSSTITGNASDGAGGGVGLTDVTGTVENTIVTGNIANSAAIDEVSLSGTEPTFNSNLLGSNTSTVTGTGNVTATSTQTFETTTTVNGVVTGTLVPNGTGTATVTILDGGAADQTGDASLVPTDAFDVDGDSNTGETLPTDQQGNVRVIDAKTSIGAVEVSSDALELVVTTLDDEAYDAGVDNSADGNGLSLREAIAIAQDVDRDANITFDASLSGGELQLTQGTGGFFTSQKFGLIDNTMVIDGDIDGDGGADITINMNRRANLFDVTGDLTLNGVNFRNGYQYGYTGQIADIYQSGVITFSNAAITQQSGYYGVSMFKAEDDATVNISDSLVEIANGSRIEAIVFSDAVTSSVNVNISNSTMDSLGQATGLAVELRRSGDVYVANSTIIGGLEIEDLSNDQTSSLTVKSSIVTGTASIGGASETTLVGANIIDGELLDGSTVLQSGLSLTDIFETGNRADNGGFRETFALSADGPAIDAVVTGSTFPETDGRGESYARIVGSGVDLGAFEDQTAPTSLSLTVTTLDDEFDSTGEINLDAMGGFDDLSLREALALAQASGVPTTINFASDLTGGTLTLTERLVFEDITVAIDGDIDGDGASDITIDLSGIDTSDLADSTAMVVRRDTDLSLNGFEFTGGYGYTLPTFLAARYGSVAISNTQVGGHSGSLETRAIQLSDGASLALDNVTIEAVEGVNGSDTFGTIDVEELTTASIELVNSTIEASGPNGAAIQIATVGDLTLENSTVLGDVVLDDETFDIDPGDGFLDLTSDIEIKNSIISGEFTGSARNQTLTYTEGNLINGTLSEDGVAIQSGFTNADIFETGTIEDNGGAVDTVLIKAGGPAEDAGGSSSESTDARGGDYGRVIGSGLDLGALELQSPGVLNLVVTTSDDELDDADGVNIADMGGLDDLSLREALVLGANIGAGETNITFDAALPRTSILIGGSEFEIFDRTVTIDGDVDQDGTIDIFLSADGQSRHFNVSNSDLTLLNIGLTNGNAGRGGSIYAVNDSSLTIENAYFTQNSASANFGGGGAIRASDTDVDISNSRFTFNLADFGGAIHSSDSDRLHIDSTLFLTNIADRSGGAIDGNDVLDISVSNSTFVGNTASGFTGGAFDLYGEAEMGDPVPTLSLFNTTITQNSANRDGGAIYSFGFDVNLYNSIVLGNAETNGNSNIQPNNITASFGIYGTGGNVTAVASLYNDEDITEVFAETVRNNFNNATGGVADYNGGPKATVAILAGGLADGTANDAFALDPEGNALTTDGRGAGYDRTVGTATDIGAFELASPSSDLLLTVTTLDDELDDASGTSISDMGGLDDLSLREALAIVANNGASASITFDETLAGGTLALTNGFDIAATVSLDGDTDGDGAFDITIDQSGAGGTTFDVASTGDLSLHGLTFTGASAGDEATLAEVQGGRLELTNSQVLDGENTDGQAIELTAGGTLELNRVAIDGVEMSAASDSAGTIFDSATDASDIDVTNSTILGTEVGNTAIKTAGGADIDAASSTIVGDVDLAGTDNATEFDIENSIVSGSIDDLGGTVTSTLTEGNLVDGTLSYDGVTQQTGYSDGDIFTTGALADNGGVVQTVEIAAYGPAFDTGGTSSETTDARGMEFEREVGGGLDLGAMEFNAFDPLILTVTTTDDELDSATGTTFAEMGGTDDLSLREALALVQNITPDTALIRFDEALSSSTLVLGGTQLDIVGNVTIDGDQDNDGSADITIDGDDLSRVFETDGGDVTLANLTVSGGYTNGSSGAANGGGIRAIDGSLTLDNVTVQDNMSGAGGYEDGGGIFSARADLTILNSSILDNRGNEGGGIGLVNASLVMEGSLVAGNTGRNYGGGINFKANAPEVFSYLPVETVNISNSTIFDNEMYGGRSVGAGMNFITEDVVRVAQASTVVLNNVTVTGNDGQGGGITSKDTLIELNNSIVAGNVSPSLADDIALRNDRLSDTLTTNTSLVGGDVADIFATTGTTALTGVTTGVLADNGGSVQTVAILEGGLAHNTGSAAYAADASGDPLETDARGAGYGREVGASVDMGAYEVQTGENLSLVVTTLTDELDAGTTEAELSAGDGLSLREALVLANAAIGEQTITFDAALADGKIVLASGAGLELSGNITIDGDIDGDGDADISVGFVAEGATDTRSGTGVEDIVLTVSAGDAVLNGLNIEDGLSSAAYSYGAGVVQEGGSLSISNSSITNSQAAYGAAVFATGGNGLSIENSFISGVDGEFASMIYANGDFTGDITITNTTIVGSGDGRVIEVNNDYGATPTAAIDVKIDASTIVDASGTYSVIDVQDSSVTLEVQNSIVGVADDSQTGLGPNNAINNTNGNAVTLSGNNLLGTDLYTGTSISQTGVAFADVFTTGVAADNGGAVQTLAIDPTGVAFDGADGGLGTSSTDARGAGYARVVNLSPDLGAFEADSVTPLFELGLSDLSETIEIAENLAEGTLVFDVDANDGVGGRLLDGVTFEIVSGNESPDGDGELAFAIDSDTGAITVNDAGDMEFDLDGQFELTIEASSALGTEQALLTIDLIDSTNNAPAFAGLDATPTFTVDGPTVVLDADATLSDADLDAANNGDGDYDGATLALQRAGGAIATDVFGFSFAPGSTISLVGTDFLVGGDIIATLFQAGGAALISFTGDAGTAPTSALVNEILQALTYDSTDPFMLSGDVNIDYTFDDGSGAADRQVMETVTVTVERAGGLDVTGTSASEEFIGTQDDDTINAGGGDDRVLGSDGADDLDGGDGSRDTLNHRGSDAGVTINLDTGESSGGFAEGDTIENFERIVGSELADDLTGESGANVIQGFDGDDTITGGAGNDNLRGGNGADEIDGGEGNDRIEGGADGDDLDGGNGSADTVVYTGSSAGVTVNLATNTASGGDAQGDTIRNFERINGSEFNDALTGNGLANRIDGLGGDDTIAGGDGNDNLRGGAGDDDIDGGSGDDQISGGIGADDLDGGSGTKDTLTYETSLTAVTVNLGTNTASGGDAQGDTIQNFERLTGSSFADTLTGDANANLIRGNAGDDTIDGGDGNDNLVGGEGADSLSGGANNDRIEGGLGADDLDGGTGAADTLVYSSSSAAVTVDLSTNTVSGGDAQGDTIQNFERVIGSGHNDSLTGDILNNRLTGGNGNDTLDGGEGKDRLDGGTGVDELTGGLGADVFAFDQFDSATALSDLITDFSGSTGEGDRLDLSSFASSFGGSTFSGTAGEAISNSAGGVTIVEVDVDGDQGADFSVRLSGEMVLGADDFIF